MAAQYPSHKRIANEFSSAVNLTADELGDWLRTDQSKTVGSKGADNLRDESVGHASGRRIKAILNKPVRDLTADDYAHMRKVIGFIRCHLAQQPANPVTSRWPYSLMNWGHDALKRGNEGC